MPQVEIAHIQEQGQQMIVVPLDGSFGFRSPAEQERVRAELQMRASAARLAGTVVIVWDQNGGMGFLAPREWHPFFRTVEPQALYASINKTLSW